MDEIEDGIAINACTIMGIGSLWVIGLLLSISLLIAKVFFEVSLTWWQVAAPIICGVAIILFTILAGFIFLGSVILINRKK